MKRIYYIDESGSISNSVSVDEVKFFRGSDRNSQETFQEIPIFRIVVNGSLTFIAADTELTAKFIGKSLEKSKFDVEVKFNITKAEYKDIVKRGTKAHLIESLKHSALQAVSKKLFDQVEVDVKKLEGRVLFTASI